MEALAQEFLNIAEDCNSDEVSEDYQPVVCIFIKRTLLDRPY
jgi:hypothetical protein